MGIFDQWNTKTLGGSNKLSKSDYDLIQDGVHVQEANKDALQLVNLVGQATNTQSQSGGIPGTQTVDSASSTAADIYETFAPGIGETWKIVAISGTLASGITRIELKLYDSTTSTYVEFGQIDGAGAAEMEGYPVMVSHPVTFVSHARGTYSSGTNYTYYSAIRVR
jgi:hypothetical protein